MDRVPEWLVLIPMVAAAAAVTLWVAGAIYYDVCGAGRWSRLIAAVWVVGVVVTFAVWQPTWQPFVALLGATALFLVWWFRQKPSHARDWDPCAAVMPRAVRDGDAVTIENVRHFEYRSLTDFDARYDTRTYRLSNLRGVDLLLFVWDVKLFGHPALVFDFGPDGRVCLSIEARLRRGQSYSLVRGLFRQQELIFVAADERDVILRRTKHGPPVDAYLYRFHAPLGEVRTAFLDYVDALNRLYETPRWYHGLAANCTTSFYRLPNSRWRIDWRVIANGRLDRALYADGRLDRTLPFEELQRSSRLNEVANEAPAEGFGDRIRRELEERRHDR
jgi:hypothetical protein